MGHILIVDDQQSVLLTLEALLRSENHTVTACTNALDAIAKLSQETFDLVISDVVMSAAGTGYALIRSLRSQPKLAQLPVILLTGKREKADVEEGIRSGANDYVVKPIDPTLLLAKIRNLLSKDEDTSAPFAAAPVQVKAEFESKTEIVSVSELGCQIKSNLSTTPGTLLRVHSEVFKEIGLSTPTLRIVSVEGPDPVDGTFRLHTTFVGLSERELTPLRLWIRGKKRF
jgi:DNA-binding response OmpR family regulator